MIKCFSPVNTDFETNGDAILMPETCSINAALNGAWGLSMTHPLDSEGRWKYIEEFAVLKVPSFNGEQLFRIKTREKSSGYVTATAEPIFLDAMGEVFLLDVRPTNATGQDALDRMLSGQTTYKGSSDITTIATAYYENKNLIEALSGTEDNAFINRWGGEIIYDNFTIVINAQAGSDNGVNLLYGKNIPIDGVNEKIDIENLVTRIVPQAYNGYMLEGDEPWIDSPLLYEYPCIYTSLIEFPNVMLKEDAKGNDDEIVCDTLEELRAALRDQCYLKFDEGIDKPTVTVSADMILLQNTREYGKYKNLESVSLGDTLHLTHNKLGITSDERCTELEYDCIAQKVTSVVIGDREIDYFDMINNYMA